MGGGLESEVNSCMMLFDAPFLLSSLGRSLLIIAIAITHIIHSHSYTSLITTDICYGHHHICGHTGYAMGPNSIPPHFTYSRSQ